MIGNIIDAVNNSTNYVEPGFVQLRNIGLPNRFLDSIEDKLWKMSGLLRMNTPKH